MDKRFFSLLTHSCEEIFFLFSSIVKAAHSDNKAGKSEWSLNDHIIKFLFVGSYQPCWSLKYTSEVSGKIIIVNKPHLRWETLIIDDKRRFRNLLSVCFQSETDLVLVFWAICTMFSR